MLVIARSLKLITELYISCYLSCFTFLGDCFIYVLLNIFLYAKLLFFYSVFPNKKFVEMCYFIFPGVS